MDDQILKFIQDHMLQGALGISFLPFIYKAYRILREDRKGDKIDEEEDKFRLMLRDESKESKEKMFKLLEEKIELSTEIARLQLINSHLLEKQLELMETIAKLKGERND